MMRTNKTIFFILLIPLSIGLLSAINNTPDENCVIWTSGYKLKWSDFQGSPNPSGTFDEEAGIKIKIEVTGKITRNTYDISVSCIFDKSKSWTTTKDTGTYLLEHEQIHFDIGEIYARQLRKKFSEMNDITDVNFEERVRKMYHDVNSSCTDYENKYEFETCHSTNRIKQALWKERVDSIMSNTKKFESRFVSISKI
jgi:hypothetical protein